MRNDHPKDTGGWILSILFHSTLIASLVLMGQKATQTQVVLSLGGGGGGGGPVSIDLLGSLPDLPEPRVPRQIRKYEEEPQPVPPTPEDLPEPFPEKKVSKPDIRPTVAPNLRPSKEKPGEGLSGETPLHFGLGKGSGSGFGEGSGPGTGDTNFPYPSWLQIAKARIQGNWRPLIPPVGETKTYIARVFFRIDRGGRLLEFNIVESSGSPVYDQSIERAIRLASPFPQLPYAYPADTLAFDLTFRYTP